MNKNRVWYASGDDVKSPDTIHQILMFGTLSDIHSLKEKLGDSAVKKIFLRYPKKIYTAPAFNFIKNFILNLQSPIDEKQYLKSTPRVTR